MLCFIFLLRRIFITKVERIIQLNQNAKMGCGFHLDWGVKKHIPSSVDVFSVLLKSSFSNTIVRFGSIFSLLLIMI
jgi:hypothetical protein